MEKEQKGKKEKTATTTTKTTSEDCNAPGNVARNVGPREEPRLYTVRVPEESVNTVFLVVRADASGVVARVAEAAALRGRGVGIAVEPIGAGQHLLARVASRAGAVDEEGKKGKKKKGQFIELTNGKGRVRTSSRYQCGRRTSSSTCFQDEGVSEKRK
jgi:hypothetical protein